MLKRTLKLTKEDKDWAKQVKDRDGWKCVVCFNDIRPNAHHILPREILELKYDVMIGITLCPNHHFFSRDISAHNNPLGFFMWMEEYRPNQLTYCKRRMKEILDGV